MVPSFQLPVVVMCFAAKASSSWMNTTTKRKRVAAAVTRKLRRVSGWNIFQREKMKEKGSLTPSGYKAAVSALSKEWASLSSEDQQAFCVQAEFEQQLREETLSKALPVKGSKAEQSELDIGSHALKKMSAARLQRNFALADGHPLWSSPCQLGDCALRRLVHCQSQCDIVT